MILCVSLGLLKKPTKVAKRCLLGKSWGKKIMQEGYNNPSR